MRPAKGERDRLVARCVGYRLVSRIPIALHDAAIAIEQLERVCGKRLKVMIPTLLPALAPRPAGKPLIPMPN